MKKIVLLATGGTIAGLAPDPAQPDNYTAALVDGQDLLQGLALTDVAVHTEQVAQMDSKDMSFAVWQSLLQRTWHWLDRDEVQGVVITHGTDTLEETAYFLQTVLQPIKPVAMTCAMRPANAPDSDGPGNLKDALNWIQTTHAHGVVVVCAGQVHAATAVQKSHSQLRDPFTSREPCVHPKSLRVPTVAQVLSCKQAPRVELVFNHAGADGRLVRDVMQREAPQGWVVAGTGNGTLHHALEAALLEAQKRGALVFRTSRCAAGGVVSRDTDVLPHAGGLTPMQARVALMLDLIARQC